MNASKSLKQAADIIGLQPAALQLRYSKPKNYFLSKVHFFYVTKHWVNIFVGDVLSEFLSPKPRGHPNYGRKGTRPRQGFKGPRFDGQSHDGFKCPARFFIWIKNPDYLDFYVQTY